MFGLGLYGFGVVVGRGVFGEVGLGLEGLGISGVPGFFGCFGFPGFFTAPMTPAILGVKCEYWRWEVGE